MAFYGYPAAAYGGLGTALSTGYSYPAGYTAASTLGGLPFGYGGYGLPAQYSVPFGAQYIQAPTVGFGAPFGAPAAPQHQIKVTYFDFAGRAEAVRLALYIAGIPFEDERLSREEWMARKEAGTNIRFGQLPLLEVGGRVLAQSLAQLMFVGELTGLYPTDSWERAKVNEALLLGEDWIMTLVPSLGEQDEHKKALRAKFAEELPKYVGFIDRLLTETNTGFLAGPRLTVADLSIYVLLEWFSSGKLDGVPTDFLKQSARVQEFRDRIHNLPRIAQWRAVQEQRQKDKEAKEQAAAAATAAAETTQNS